MQLFLASGNPHKAREFQDLAAAAGLPIEVVAAASAGGMPPVVENAGSFEGNARKKARALKAILRPEAWSLADDSGLCVDALGGAPGVESAYYAGPQGDAAANLAKLVETMRGVPSARRGAHFTCVLIVAGPSGEEHVFQGACEGRLLETPRGGAGFGYDPLFVPEGSALSFAELGDSIKNDLSHRARAWKGLAAWMGRRFFADSIDTSFHQRQR